MLVPDFFPEQFKTGAGTVHCYFEALTVILPSFNGTDVLEARAHSKRQIRRKGTFLKLAPTRPLKLLMEKRRSFH